ncbi:MAG: hypothetical protein LBU11_09450 [Zoogloeaceae bacterium]|jgi:hypothetical protein|nr:hypothetical protein [Zoogloeaceae bacterium]
MKLKFFRKKFLFCFFVSFLLYLFFAGYVDNEITEKDREAIGKLGVEKECVSARGFDAEISWIKSIQMAIRDLVTDFRCATPPVNVEPHDFMSRGFGCCYDRARFTEKALRHYGFSTRHVAIYDAGNHGVFSIFIPGIPSHATTEVRTQKGWLGVDSNHPFLLLTRDGKPLTYRNFKAWENDIPDPVVPRSAYERELLIIYGLYSRHGKFHGPNLPGPEFVLAELRYNFFKDDHVSSAP